MSRDRTVRVAVVSADGRTSGTWRIWVSGEDIYVAPRHDAGLHKVSLHPHGWRWAYTERYPRGPGEFLPEGHDRCLYRFSKPPFIDGAQFAFAIAIQPHGLLKLPLDSKAVSLPTPSGSAWRKVLRIYVTEPGVDPSDIGLLFAFEVVPPSPLGLRSGRGVWVLATDEEWPAEEHSGEPIVGAAVKFVDFEGGGPNDAPGLVQVGVRLSSGVPPHGSGGPVAPSPRAERRAGSRS